MGGKNGRAWPARAIVVALCALGCDARQWPPVAESDRELISNVIGILDCGSAANPDTAEVYNSSLFIPGEVSPVEATACVRSLFDRAQIQVFPPEEIGSACGGPGAGACTVPSHDDGCGRDIIRLRSDSIPSSFLAGERIPDGGGTRSAGHLATLMYHESIHTLQSGRLDACFHEAVEPEAYVHQRRFADWLSRNMRLIATGNELLTTPCDASLDEALALGFDACLDGVVRRAEPGIDGSARLGGAECADFRLHRVHVEGSAGDALTQYATFNPRGATECISRLSAVGRVRVRLPGWEIDVVAVEGTNTLILSRSGVPGAPDFSFAFRVPLDSIEDLLVRAAAGGSDHLLVAGLRDGHGEVVVFRDEDSPEFPADGIIDTLVATMATPALTDASSLVLGATDDDVYVWDRSGQRAFLLTDSRGVAGATPDGVPDGIDPLPVLRVPVDRHGEDLVFAIDEPAATVTFAPLEDGGVDVDEEGMFFRDDDGDGLFTFAGVGDALDAEIVPPTYLDVPSAGATGLWVSCQRDHVIAIASSDSAGAIGSERGRAVCDAAGFARVSVTPPLTEGGYTRLSDISAGLNGPFVPAVSARIQAWDVRPRAVTAGTPSAVTLRGGDFSSVRSAIVGGRSATVASATVGTLRLNLPVLPVGVHDITLLTDNGKFDVATVRAVERTMISFDAASELRDLLRSGNGWNCGSVLGPLGPASADPHGCVFAGVRGSAGFLTTPALNVSNFAGEPFVVEIEHDLMMGADGDGAVVQVRFDGGAWETLVARGTVGDRVDSAYCAGCATARVCYPDSPVHGLLGFGGEDAVSGWSRDIFDVDGDGTLLELRFGATRFGSADVHWAIDAIRVYNEEVGGPPRPVVVEERAPLLSCDVVATEGGFRCLSTGLPDLPGPVLRFGSVGRRRGRALLPLDLSGVVPGMTAAVDVTHRFDFRRGTAVTGGGGYVELCCDSGCTLAVPARGYPGTLGGNRPAWTDAGVEGVVASDRFDVSTHAGEICTLEFVAKTRPRLRGPGWDIAAVDLVTR